MTTGWAKRTYPLVLIFVCLAQAATVLALNGMVGTVNTVGLLLVLPALILLVPVGMMGGFDLLGNLAGRLNWTHGLVILCFMSALVFRIRDARAAQDAPLDAWALYRVGLVAIVAFVLLIRWINGDTPLHRYLFRGLVGAALVFTLVSLVSTVWSVFPAWTLYKSFEFFVDVALLAALLTHAASLQCFRTLLDLCWVLCFSLICTVWLGVLIWPADAVIRDVGVLGVQIQGVVPSVSANYVGGLSAAIAAVSLNRLIFASSRGRRRAPYQLAFAISIVTLIFAQSRTSILGFVAAAAVVLLFARRIGPAAFVVVLAGVALLQAGVVDTVKEYLMRGQDEVAVKGLSGRVTWWTIAWTRFLDQPFTGYGSYAGGRFVALQSAGYGSVSSLHNAYLEVLMGTSIWGLAPVLAMVVGTWFRLIRGIRTVVANSFHHELLTECIVVATLETIGSLSSTGIVWHPAIPFLFVMGYTEYLKRQRAVSEIKLWG